MYYKEKVKAQKKNDLKVLGKLPIGHEEHSGVLPPPGQVSPLFTPESTLQLKSGLLILNMSPLISCHGALWPPGYNDCDKQLRSRRLTQQRAA